MVALRADFEIN